jgi:L-cysteine:1D-myo-inositol 2-amino-2-deoxy-alpha-D-glucopyranoside ligase
VYFEVSKFPKFGQISHLNRAEMLRLAKERGGNPDDPHKRDPLDFVLWQPSQPDEPAWDSLWGPGRPGWHIECSALCLRELGTSIDLHGGGSDLIFPHHECEAAQSEAATGEPLVRHWMHQAMVRMGGEKMSKSLGNLVFVSDLSLTWDPRAIRLACLSHHYRNSWEWHDSLMTEASDRLLAWVAASSATENRPSVSSGSSSVLEQVRLALDNDLETPAALSAIDSAVKEGALERADLQQAAQLLGVNLSRPVLLAGTALL